jgi:hypothetical protein
MEITYSGSHVLIMCVVGVWRHIVDLWCVCVCVCVCVCARARARCVGLRIQPPRSRVNEENLNILYLCRWFFLI